MLASRLPSILLMLQARGLAAQMGLADVLSAARLKFLAALSANVQPSAGRLAKLHRVSLS